MKKYIYTYN